MIRRPFVTHYVICCRMQVDEHLGELFLMEEPIDGETLRAAIRRCVGGD